MPLRAVVLAVALGMVAGACASDDRQWMKVGEKYTTAEFRRDYTECSRSGKLDDACMRSRGWIAVKPGKPEEKRDPDVLTEQRSKGLPSGGMGY